MLSGPVVPRQLGKSTCTCPFKGSDFQMFLFAFKIKRQALGPRQFPRGRTPPPGTKPRPRPASGKFVTLKLDRRLLPLVIYSTDN